MSKVRTMLRATGSIAIAYSRAAGHCFAALNTLAWSTMYLPRQGEARSVKGEGEVR